ncbi:MAG: AMP-binding protein [Pseudohongiellaceae bacterium]
MTEQLTGELNPDRFNCLTDVMDYIFHEHGELNGFSCFGADLNYRSIEEYSNRFAGYLTHATELEAGDRIAIQLPNILQFPVALYGALKAGLIVVNTNPLYTTREMRHQFKDAGVKAIVILENFCDKLEEVLPDTDIKTVIITKIADLLPAPRRFILNAGAKYIKKLVPEFHIKGAVTFRSTIANPARENIPGRQCQGDDTALILYTGGTTGYAKGVMLTHKNLISNMMQLRSRCLKIIRDREDTILAPLPLYHSYAFLFHCLVMPFAGNCSLLIPNPRDLNSLVDVLLKKKIQGMVGINTLFLALLNHRRIKNVDFDALRFSGAGGMPLTRSVAEEWEFLTGCEIFEGYGLTECSPVVSVNPPGSNKPGTVGPPVPATEVRVMGDDGVELAAGAKGELWVKGPQVMKGYWNRPQDTDQVLTPDGWFKTGDYVQIDEDGYLRIVDRKKDMILVSGFNVIPGEIEEYVNTHPDIMESAAIGVPNEQTGEAVVLYVVSRNPQLEREELLAYCKKGLTGYKLPRVIVFADSLPKSNIGKVLKRELRELYTASL